MKIKVKEVGDLRWGQGGCDPPYQPAIPPLLYLITVTAQGVEMLFS